MRIVLDDTEISKAVDQIHEWEDGEYTKEEIKDQFEQWLQDSAEIILEEFEYFAFGPHRILSDFDLKHETRPRFAMRTEPVFDNGFAEIACPKCGGSKPVFCDHP